MNYENYYDNMDNNYGQKPPRRGGTALLVIVVAAVFLIIGMLLTGFLQSLKSSEQAPLAAETPFALPQNTPGEDEETPAPSATVKPSPTPLPTERPMAALDGVAPTLPAEGNPIPDIVDAVEPSVVGVVNYGENKTKKKTVDKEDLIQGMGSGFIISSQGYILTNAHVVDGAKSLAVTLADGEEVKAELTGVDEISDIAVLKIDKTGLKALQLGDSSSIRVGDYVVAVGNPLGKGLEGTVTMGIISARMRSITIGDHTNTYIQTDAAINVGNSGGPLLNMKGEVIGINTAKTINAGYDESGMAITTEGLGFALPINEVRKTAETLITKGFVQHAALGVHIATLTQDELDQNKITTGVLVVSVVRGGPAGTAGVKPGDIITTCDGTPVKDQNQLASYINTLTIGTTIKLDVIRDGKAMSIIVKLADMSGLDYNNVDSIDKGSN